MINDLRDHLEGVESSLFADDSCIFKSGKNLDHIKNYIQANLDNRQLVDRYIVSKWQHFWDQEATCSH